MRFCSISVPSFFKQYVYKLSSAKDWLWGFRLLIVLDRRFEGLCEFIHWRWCGRFPGDLSWKFDEDQLLFGRERISWGLECWWFLIGDLKDGIIFDIIDHIDSWYGRYPEIFIKIRHDLAEKGEGGTWRMLMVPDWRLRGLGSSFTS